MSPAPSLAFFSYSRHDSEFVLKLAKDLRAAGADLWLDQLDINAGQHWDTVIAEALGRSTLLLVVLSPESVTSDNVMDEVSFALDKRKTVIPVLHKACEVPFRLRRMQYADFTAAYEKGLAALLKALEVRLGTPAPPPEEQQPPVPPPRREPQGAASAQPARQPATSPSTVGMQPGRQGISRGTLIAIAVGVLVLGAILWRFIAPSKPQPDITTTAASVKPEDSSKAADNAGDSGVAAPPTSQVKPPDAAWVNSFLSAEQGPSPDGLRPFFDGLVSPYYAVASAGWQQIAQDKRSYFARFPSINYSLVGEPTYYSSSEGAGKIEFLADYSETRNDGKAFQGQTQMSLAVHYVDDSWKITAITERKVH